MVCGIVTVGLVYWIGLLVFDRATGLWAAWLAAISPPLVYYSREARMYALLVMIACLCWGLLFSLRKSSSHGKSIAYALCLAALVYCHPLGLLMAATLGLGSFLFVRQFFDRWQRWLGVHLAALLLAAPWIRHYFDHDPEFLSGRLPVKFLIGTPIGFIGGNSVVLLGLLILIGFGLLLRRGVFAGYSDWSGPACLVLWLVVPPTLLYAYSWLGNPVFGPSRYTLYTAPAYLILVAQGLARLPPLTRACVAVALVPFDRAGTGCNGLRTGTEGRLEGVLDRAGGADGPEPRYRGHGVCEILRPCPKQGDPDRPLLSPRALPDRPPGGRGSRQTRERAKRRSLRGSRDQGGSRQVALGGRVRNPQHECVRGAHGLPGCRSPPRSPLGFSKIGSIRALRS